jgi:hypothetical protein
MLACAGLLALLSGCVERRFVIESSPPGAKVYVNNRPVGFTPVDVPFTYYGTYHITLELDRYETRQIDQRVVAPWFGYPPVDLVVENFNPFWVRDIRRLGDDAGTPYQMTPMPRPNLDDLRLQAEELRQRGKQLPEPTKPVTPPARPTAPPPASLPPPTPADPRTQPSPYGGPPPLDPVP